MRCAAPHGTSQLRAASTGPAGKVMPMTDLLDYSSVLNAIVATAERAGAAKEPKDNNPIHSECSRDTKKLIDDYWDGLILEAVKLKWSRGKVISIKTEFLRALKERREYQTGGALTVYLAAISRLEDKDWLPEVRHPTGYFPPKPPAFKGSP
jgi:hypothetical protein